MGWLFTKGQSRAALIERRIHSEDNEAASYSTIAHCTKGNVLWTVREVIHKQATGNRIPDTAHRYIGCDLMACQRGFGWGYKDMDESVHPYYYTCPLSFLDMAPKTCPDWRALVREYHARMSREIRIGDIWSLQPGYTVRQVEIVSIKPLHGIGRPDGRRYRLRRSVLADRLDNAPDETTCEALTAAFQAASA